MLPFSVLTNLANDGERVSTRHPAGRCVQSSWWGPPEGEGGYLETGDFSFISHHIHKEGEVAARGDERRQSTVGFLMLVMDQ